MTRRRRRGRQALTNAPETGDGPGIGVVGRINEVGGALAIGAASLGLLLNPVLQAPIHLVQTHSRVVVGSEVQGDRALVISEEWHNKGDDAESDIDELIALVLERHEFRISDIPAIRRHALTQYVYNSYSPSEVQDLLQGREGSDAQLDGLFEVVRLDVSGSVASIAGRIQASTIQLNSMGRAVPAREKDQLPVAYAQQLELMLVEDERMPHAAARAVAEDVIDPSTSAALKLELFEINQKLTKLSEQGLLKTQDYTRLQQLFGGLGFGSQAGESSR